MWSLKLFALVVITWRCHYVVNITVIRDVKSLQIGLGLKTSRDQFLMVSVSKLLVSLTTDLQSIYL